MEVGASGPRASLLAVDGWATEADAAYFRRMVVDEAVYARSPTFARLIAKPGPLVTRSREQLAPDREWYSSFEYQHVIRPAGTDDHMGSLLHASEPTAVQVLVTIRPAAERLFLPRRRLFRVFHGELARHYGRELRRRSAGPFDAFPPRLRRTLRCLLEGDSEKQAAARLGLSRHTIHDYVLEIYRRVGVASRAELMAYCLRHRVSPDDASPPA